MPDHGVDRGRGARERAVIHDGGMVPRGLVLALLASCSAIDHRPSSSGGATAISGRVLGADGRPMPGAHARVIDPLEGFLAQADAAPSGDFHVSVKAEGLVVLELSGPDHETGLLHVPLEGGSLRIEALLRRSRPGVGLQVESSDPRVPELAAAYERNQALARAWKGRPSEVVDRELEDVLRRAAVEPASLLRDLALHTLVAELSFRIAEGAAARVRRVLALLPPSSPVWRLEPRLPAQLAARLGAEGDRWLDAMITAQTARQMRVHLLLGAVANAHRQRRDADLVRHRERFLRELGDHPAASDVRRFTRNVVKGGQVPRFSAPALGGGPPITDQSLRGMVYLVHFCASDLPPCQDLEWLHGLHRRMPPERFTILTLWADTSAEAVGRLRTAVSPMPWRHGLIGDDADAPLPRAFDVMGLPHYVLVDASGVVVGSGEELAGPGFYRDLARLLR